MDLTETMATITYAQPIGLVLLLSCLVLWRFVLYPETNKMWKKFHAAVIITLALVGGICFTYALALLNSPVRP